MYDKKFFLQRGFTLIAVSKSPTEQLAISDFVCFFILADSLILASGFGKPDLLHLLGTKVFSKSSSD
jgi:hypothetical protein